MGGAHPHAQFNMTLAIGILIGLPLGAILAIVALAWYCPPEDDEGPHYTTENGGEKK